MTPRVARRLISKWTLSEEARSKVQAEKEMYQETARELKANMQVFKQPGNHENGCCLIAAAVNCMKDAQSRAALLGLRGDMEVDTTKLQTYAEYQTYYLQHHPKATNHQYCVMGLRHWLEHLVKNQFLKRFVLKHCPTFEQGLAAILSSRMEKLKGKSFIAMCYRRGSGKQQEDYDRLFKCARVRSLWRAFATLGVRNRGATGSDLAKQRQKMALTLMLDRWQGGPQKCDPPVHQLRRINFEDLRRLAVEKTLGKHENLPVWMEKTKRSVASFQLEVYYRIMAAKVDSANAHAAHLAARNRSDTRSINEVTREVRAVEPACTKRKAEKVANEENDAEPTRKPWNAKIGNREFRAVWEEQKPVASGSATAGYTPVTRHAIAMHVLDNGDVVIADPASNIVRLLSRKNVLESCWLFCQLIADFDCVFELSVEL